MKIKNCKLSRFAGSRMAGKILLFCLVFLVFGFVGRKADASVILKAPNNLGLVGYWSFNEGVGGLAGDSSGNRNTGTLTGANGLPAWTNGKLGKALKFDGTDDVVTVGTSAFTTGATTITMWVKPTASQQNGLGDLRVGGSGLIIYERTIGAIAERAMMGFRGQPEMNTPTSVITVGAWTFLAFVYNGGAKNDLASFAIYANGVNQTSLTAQGTIGGSTTYNRVGSDQSSAFFNGSIDEVRIYNRALTANEISQLYQSGAAKLNVSPTKYLTSGLVGYWTMDGNNVNWATGKVTDSSGQGNSGYVTNMATSTGVAIGKIGQALKFDGSDDYVEVPDNASLKPTSISVETWVRPAAGLGSQAAQVKKTSDSNGFSLEGSLISFWVNVNGTWRSSGAALPSAMVANQWYHCVGTYDGVNIKVYVNGELKNTGNYPGSITWATSLLNIGRDPIRPTEAARMWNGLIDDVRIYNRALSTGEVLNLYNAGK